MLGLTLSRATLRLCRLRPAGMRIKTVIPQRRAKCLKSPEIALFPNLYNEL
jgi:hypothetical protein